MGKKVGKVVLQGLAAVLPLAVTIYALWWLVSSAESVLGPPILGLLKQFGKGDWYIRGMGVVAGLVVVAVIGILAQLWIARELLALGDRIIERIPLAKTVYGAVKDLLGLFSGSKTAFSKVVLVTLPGTSMKLLGMVTKEDFNDMPQAGRDAVGVYLPMSYQIGGFTVMVPRDSIERVDMTAEEAMRFAMTAGVSGESAAPGERQPKPEPETLQEAGDA